MEEPLWTNPPAHPDEATQSWRSQYLAERRRARIFMVTTALSLAALMATLAFNVVNDDPVQVRTAVAGEELADPPGDGTGLRGGRGDLGGVERFVNDDGSLNTAAVDETLSRFGGLGGVPERFAERMIGNVDDAVAAGRLTEQQGMDLLDALGISGGSDV